MADSDRAGGAGGLSHDRHHLFPRCSGVSSAGLRSVGRDAAQRTQAAERRLSNPAVAGRLFRVFSGQL